MLRDKAPFFLLFFLVVSGCATYPPTTGAEVAPKGAGLLTVAGFRNQVTGVAVSGQGRIFVNFPRWVGNPRYSVAELLPDGSLRPYPDASWNSYGKMEAAHPESHFVCVQSVFVDDDDFLWILDPASPSFSGVVPGGAKLLKVNLKNNQVEQVIRFSPDIAPLKSYLNDVRVDVDNEVAYLTDSGLGALVVVDLDSGKIRRLLDDHPSTKAEPGFVPVIDGVKLLDQSGKPPQIHADGIALDAEGEYLYYHALTARTLYRIKTDYLLDTFLTSKDIGAHVEKVADTGAVDGMVMDYNDTLYFTALGENAIKYRHNNGVIGTVVQSSEIQWPDSMSIGPEGDLYFTASQIHRMPRFRGGKDRRIPPYQLFKYWIAPF